MGGIVRMYLRVAAIVLVLLSDFGSSTSRPQNRAGGSWSDKPLKTGSIAQFVLGIIAGPIAGQDANVGVIFEKGVATQFGSWSIYFRIGGESLYELTRLTGTGDTLYATLPARVVTPAGIEYYIRSSGNDGILPDYGPAIMFVTVPQQTAPLTLKSRVFKMISIPLELSNPLPQNVLRDSYGEYDPNNWRLFRWQNNGYAELPRMNRAFAPGASFWLVTSSANPLIVRNARSVPTLQPSYVQLDTGWNQIADPFIFPVAWDGVANSDQVSPPYYFDGTEFVISTGVLLPWEGYFVHNSTGRPLTLVIPPIRAGAPVGKQSAGMGLNSEKEYQLQLSAESPDGRLKDTFNYLGFKDQATESEDRFDYEDPPPVSQGIRLSIVDGQVRYMTNFKPFPREGDSWKFLISSDIPDQQVRVTLRETGQLADGFGLYLLDLDNGNVVVPIGGSFAVHVDRPNTERAFEILIGTRSFAEGHSESIPLEPVAYTLGQNYPNPFNPVTIVQYSLSRRVNVSLRVYNTLGQLVATLVNEVESGGHHEVRFDGGKLASGVYFYRLTTDEFDQARKMLLLR